MSVRVMSQVWASDLGRDDKYILLCLADFGNDEGESIYPAVGYIVWKTGYSETQVKAILRKLRKSGLIGVAFEGSKYGTNQYKINIDLLPTRPPYSPPKKGRPEKGESETDPILEDEKGGSETDPRIGKGGAVFEKQGSETDPNTLENPPANIYTLDSGGDKIAAEGDLPGDQDQVSENKNGSRTQAQKKGDLVDGLLKFAQDQEGKIDVGHFPEDVREIVSLYCELWDQLPPMKNGKKGGEFALWIDDARNMRVAGGDLVFDALRSIKSRPYEWMAKAMIGRPGALIRAVRARAGEIRENRSDIQNRSVDIEDVPGEIIEETTSIYPEANPIVYEKVVELGRSPFDLWETVKMELKASMAMSSYRAYVEPTKIVNYKDRILSVYSPDESSRAWLEDRMTSTVRRSLAGITGYQLIVCFETIREEV